MGKLLNATDYLKANPKLKLYVKYDGLYVATILTQEDRFVAQGMASDMLTAILCATDIAQGQQ